MLRSHRSQCVLTEAKAPAYDLTAADGGFRLDGVPAGLLTVEARFPGRTSAKVEHAPSGSSGVEVVLAPVVPPWTLLVTHADGTPVRRFSVTAFSRTGNPGAMSPLVARGQSTNVQSSEGRFTPPEEWSRDDGRAEVEVLAIGEGARVSIVPIAGTTSTIRVVLAEAGAIRGLVKASGGGPVANAVATVRRDYEASGSRNRVARTDSDGRFELAPLVPGRYVVTIDAESFPRRILVVETRSGEVTELAQTLAFGGIRIRVLDTDARPVPSADASLLDLEGAPAVVRPANSSSDHRLGSTALDGTLEVNRVDPGKYQVGVGYRGQTAWQTGTSEVEVRDGETAEVVVCVPR